MHGISVHWQKIKEGAFCEIYSKCTREWHNTVQLTMQRVCIGKKDVLYLLANESSAVFEDQVQFRDWKLLLQDENLFQSCCFVFIVCAKWHGNVDCIGQPVHRERDRLWALSLWNQFSPSQLLRNRGGFSTCVGSYHLTAQWCHV